MSSTCLEPESYSSTYKTAYIDAYKTHCTYAYWTVHHLDICMKVDRLDDTCLLN